MITYNKYYKMKIAITGKMCYGKTTIANLIKSMNDDYEIFSFGKKVKEIAKDLFDMQTKDRTLLTSIGTKMREIDPDVWVNYIIKQTEGIEYCLIDDLRYQNEYENLIKNDWKIIQLNVSDELQHDRIKSIYPDNYEDHFKNLNHESEKNEFQWKNNGPDLIIDSSEDKNKIKSIITDFILS